MKQPAFQFYPGDWLRDTGVLSATARGVWISLIVAMWDRKVRGKFSGTVEEVARLAGATSAEISGAFSEFETHDICDLKRDGNANVTIVSRRMVRDEKNRESTRGRVENHRKKRAGNATVTDEKQHGNTPLHSSSSSSGTSYLCVNAQEAFEILTSRPELSALTPEQWQQVRKDWGGHPRIATLDWTKWTEWTVAEAIKFGQPDRPAQWLSKRLGEWLEKNGAVEPVKNSGADKSIVIGGFGP